jgi:hypothetical protein
VGLQHIVLFSFADGLAVAEAEEMRAQVAAWPEAIGAPRSLDYLLDGDTVLIPEGDGDRSALDLLPDHGRESLD